MPRKPTMPIFRAIEHASHERGEVAGPHSGISLPASYIHGSTAASIGLHGCGEDMLSA